MARIPNIWRILPEIAQRCMFSCLGGADTHGRVRARSFAYGIRPYGIRVEAAPLS